MLFKKNVSGNKLNQRKKRKKKRKKKKEKKVEKHKLKEVKRKNDTFASILMKL